MALFCHTGGFKVDPQEHGTLILAGGKSLVFTPHRMKGLKGLNSMFSMSSSACASHLVIPMDVLAWILA